jgi:hypothetical protein
MDLPPEPLVLEDGLVSQDQEGLGSKVRGAAEAPTVVRLIANTVTTIVCLAAAAAERGTD